MILALPRLGAAVVVGLIVLVTIIAPERGSRVHGLAAKKPVKDQGLARRASSNKGFGAKPLTFDDVVGKFKTRLRPNARDEPCPCGLVPDATYGNCCAPYHEANNSEMVAESPLRVLQTRYSAFCHRLVPYIMETTHSTCRDYQSDRIAWARQLDKNGMFDSYEFVALEPGATTYSTLFPNNNSDDDDDDDETKSREEAFLEFNVRLKSIRDGKETIVSEKSRFLRDERNRWLYASGDVRSKEAGLEDIKLNP
jgi:SEC-C motif domain protein